MQLNRLIILTFFLNLSSCASLEMSNATKQRAGQPKLRQAKYKTIWVPDKIEGDRFIEGHRVHIIEEAGRWMSE